MDFTKVILVDEHDHELGTIEKLEAHRQGLLHRAFSVFIFNNDGKMLLQRRALSKYHSPGLWTNACCSHPAPGEPTHQAANRRLEEEMGFSCELMHLGAFTYKTQFDNGLTENEFDHVFLGLYSGKISPNKEEVDEFKWSSINEIDDETVTNGEAYTYWFHIAYPIIKKWLSTNPAG